MTSRRGRVSQVKPRPPSNGRPAPSRIKGRPAVTSRIATHRRVERGGRLPFVARIAFALMLVALGAGVLYAATGGLGRVAAALGTSMGGFIDGLTATASPKATDLVLSDAPVIAPATEPYTNVDTVDLVIMVPAAVVGRDDTSVRVYLALGDQPAAPIEDVPVGTTRQLVVPVQLTDGQNGFTATIVGPAGESESSAIVTWVLDTAAPKITLTSPKNGATVNRAAVVLNGKTQARSSVVAHNDANNASATGEAGSDGTFQLTVPIEAGSNAIRIGATDPAGNTAELVVSVRRGSGKLTANLSASVYRFSAKRLPDPLTLTVAVTDPDGRPVADAEVTFTLSIPGFPVVVAPATTDANGRASYRTTVNKGATVGTGPATVQVTTSEFGSTSDQTVITITK